MFAKKSFGQNFLQDNLVIDRIVTALKPQAGEAVIEIGAGRGALTERLLAAGLNVTAIEFERDMIAVLEDRFGNDQNFHLIKGDALTVDLTAIHAAAPIKVVGNLPYNISTAILQRLMSVREHFSLIVLMFQREVVERITAKPGDSSRGYLSVLVENAFTSERLFDVSPTAFVPAPKVWSSVVSLIPKQRQIADEKKFAKLVSRGFAERRKTILNNLKSYLPDAAKTLAATSIDSTRRAETLTLNEWKRLFESTTQ